MCFNYSINAGCTALPALLNIKQVMQQRQVTGIWSGKDELPVSEIRHVRNRIGDKTS